MKPKQVESTFTGERRREFIRTLLRDLDALDRLLAAGMIEEGVRRVGAEQELFLVDRNWHPAPVVVSVLEQLQDPHFTTELGAFQIELNLDPHRFGGDCFSRMEQQLEQKLARLRSVIAPAGHAFVMTGILPTLRHSDLGLDNMVPNPRYQAIDRAMMELRGNVPMEVYIKGADVV